ncbi:uncharacterized protein LOC125810025 [Solanum verrucosum]|uniref:uncharacterized protein LOC125810025 n=1 Tax=Solanum verrucosum TaxID=315347 RepID=UPI0020D13ACE|nr:uncharacterized protein LOC125810025 [Solanum verrucosum]
MEKKDAKPRFIRWVLFLQEFDFVVKDRKGTEHQVVDHLSRLEEEVMLKFGDRAEINDAFPDEQVLATSHALIPWFADFANYLAEVEMMGILEAYHSSPIGGHHSGVRTVHKILQCGGRIAALVEGQVLIAYQGHDRTVPPNANIIHGDVHDRVKGDGPAQAPPSIISTPVLQDTLARILGLLEGMAQVGTLLVTSDASQTRVEGQTPNPMISLDSQNQPAAAIAPCLDSMEFLCIASHLANRPSMTIDEQKMFKRF